MEQYNISYEPIESIICHPQNANIGDVDDIRKSIRRFGWVGVVVVQESTGYALVGNTRLIAAAREGIKDVPVLWATLNDDQSVRFMNAHNFSRQKAVVDDVLLLDVMSKLDSFEGTGFTHGDYERLLKELQPPPGFGGGDGDGDGSGLPGTSLINITVGHYSFSVEPEAYREMYTYVLEESGHDLVAAADLIKENLGFSLG